MTAFIINNGGKLTQTDRKLPFFVRRRFLCFAELDSETQRKMTILLQFGALIQLYKTPS